MAKKSPKNHAPLTAALIVILVLGYYALSHAATRSSSAIKPLNGSDLQARFVYLSQVHTNLCALPAFINSLQIGSYVQGSCCTPMNLTSYVGQVNGLRDYSNIPQIPKDPYNISVSLAKELLGYQNLTLTGAQQALYDQAFNMSTEHGPCCCRCWRWYAFEGQAKYLILHYNFGATKIANIWDLEDGCGGPAGAGGFQPPAA